VKIQPIVFVKVSKRSREKGSCISQALSSLPNKGHELEIKWECNLRKGMLLKTKAKGNENENENVKAKKMPTI
jgi:G:T-mismatch repair DNA endonuclease (very short patch repair protein)